MHQEQGLKRGLSARHIRFMALGSAIGTGLFYGSASAIQMAGPAVLLAYLIGGAAVFMVMRALGEMAVHNPVSGSFGQYASTYLGPMAGFILGWTYAFEMIIVCLADVTAFGIYMGFWFPDVARWVWVLGIVFLIGGLNLCNVKVFGEMEFWLSLLKPALLATADNGVLICCNNLAKVGMDDWRDQVLRCAEKAGRPVRDWQIMTPGADFPSLDQQPPLKTLILQL